VPLTNSDAVSEIRLALQRLRELRVRWAGATGVMVMTSPLPSLAT
jgi:hypothetical protein